MKRFFVEFAGGVHWFRTREQASAFLVRMQRFGFDAVLSEVPAERLL